MRTSPSIGKLRAMADKTETSHADDDEPLNAEEQAILRAVVEEGLRIQHRFRAEPLYRDTGTGHMKSETVEEIRDAKSSSVRFGK